MKYRNLRSMLIDGVSRLALTVDDDAGEGGAGGGGGAPAPAAAPAAEGDVPAAPDAGAEPAASAEGGEEEAGGEEPPAEPVKTRTPWQVKRIDALTAEKRAAEEARQKAETEAAEAKAQLAAFEALYGKQDGTGAQPVVTPPVPEGARVYTEDDFKAEVARRAENDRLNERLDGLYQDGQTKYGPDWKTRIDAAGQAFGKDLATRVDLFQAIAKLPNGADVYHHLTGDLDHMAEVLSMGPVDLGIELAQLSTKAAAKPKGPAVSRAPAPIEVVNGEGGGGEREGAETMDDYAKGWKSPAERRADREQRRG
jgi:hypothetical protein